MTPLGKTLILYYWPDKFQIEVCNLQRIRLLILKSPSGNKGELARALKDAYGIDLPKSLLRPSYANQPNLWFPRYVNKNADLSHYVMRYEPPDLPVIVPFKSTTGV